MEAVENDKWTNWSEDIKKIPFKTTVKGQGSGEDRIAYLFNTKPKGQNVPYDIDLPSHYKNTKGEVKELDSADTFQVGRDGRDRLRAIKTQIIKLLDIINDLVTNHSNHFIEDTDITPKMIRILKISPDEICKSNISLINEICRYLHDLKQRKYVDLPIVDMYDSISGLPVQMNMLIAFKIMIAGGKKEQDMKQTLGEHFDDVRLLAYLDHPYILDPLKMTDDLNGICDMFHLSTLIFVNEKGYYVLCSDIKHKICFERITLGNPRFKVRLEKL